MSEDVERNKSLVRSFFDAINRGDHGALDDIVADQFVRHCQATPEIVVQSRDDLKRFDDENRKVFPDQHASLERLVAEDAHVAFWARYQGTQEGQMGPFPPTHKRIDSEFAGIFRFANGKIEELWITWDNVAVLSQLGHFPSG